MIGGWSDGGGLGGGGIGGGGFGNPLHRDPVNVARDVSNGFVSEKSAREDYGVALYANGEVNQNDTELLRSQ